MLVQLVVFSDLLVQPKPKVEVLLTDLAFLLTLAFFLAPLQFFVGLPPVKETGGHIIPREFSILDLFRPFSPSLYLRHASD